MKNKFMPEALQASHQNCEPLKKGEHIKNINGYQDREVKVLN